MGPFSVIDENLVDSISCRSWVDNHSCSDVMCTQAMSCPETIFPWLSPHLLVLTFLPPFLLWLGGSDTAVPFRGQELLFQLLSAILTVMVFLISHHLLQWEASLMRLGTVQIYGYKHEYVKGISHNDHKKKWTRSSFLTNVFMMSEMQYRLQEEKRN